MKKRAGYSFLFRILSSAVLVTLLFYKFNPDFNQLIYSFRAVKNSYVVLSMMGVLLLLFIKSQRWYCFIRMKSADPGWCYAYQTYMAAFALGVATPGRFGEWIKMTYLRARTDLSLIDSFETVLQDRLIDLVFLIGIVWLTAAHLIFKLPYAVILLTVPILLWVAGRFLDVLLLPDFMRKSKPGRFFDLLVRTLHSLFQKKAFTVWILTALSYGLFFMSHYSLIKALNLEIPFIHLIHVVSIVTILVYIPISIAGFGTRETAFILMFAPFSITTAESISFSITQFLVFLVWGSIISLVFWMVTPPSLQTIKRDSMEFYRSLLKSGSTDPL